MKRNKPFTRTRKSGTQYRRRRPYRWNGWPKKPNGFCTTCWVRYSGPHCQWCTIPGNETTN